MRIDSLEAYNIENDIIDIWKQTIGKQLLPVQEMAVKEYALFSGGNLIVFSPTSSGKTFIGEMAAVRAARGDKRVFYLVPQKALAEEKYHEFKKRYDGTGIKLAISSRDHREFDQDIEKANFQIAVVVFEKMQSLLVSKPNLVDMTGLIVVDELQLITDDTRGPSLELLLTKIVTSKSRPRILGLSAVLGKAELLAKWLNAKLLVDNRRPVELRKGILCKGTFTYREHNTSYEGSEELVDIGMDNKKEVILANIEHLIRQGEQVLMFLPTRPEAVVWAKLIAARLNLPAISEAIEEVREYEDTEARRVLWEVLSSSVAFHNSDLRPEERDLVERHFRNGSIRVLCSTSTLAMGMNLPAKNVIIEERKWTKSKAYRRHVCQPITKSDYENMSGRAGRYSLTPDFGRSILVTTSPFQAKTWMRTFVDAPFEEIKPTLLERPLEDHVLNLVASGLCSSQAEIEAFLRGSFTGYVHWGQEMSREEFRGALSKAISKCAKGDLVRSRGKILTVSDIGRACATQGLSAGTGIALASWARRNQDSAIYPLEVLAVASLTEDGNEIYIYLRKNELYKADYRPKLLALATKMGCADRKVFHYFQDNLCNFDLDNGRVQKKTLFLHEWIEEVKTGDIEKAYCIWAGAIRKVAEEYSWLVDAMAAIARAVGWSIDRQQELSDIASRLVSGVKQDAVYLARLRVRGLGRTYLRCLVDAGFNDPESLQNLSLEDLQSFLKNKRVTKSVWERLHAGEQILASYPKGQPPIAMPRVAETQPQYGNPDLVVDLRGHRVTYRGYDIPTKPPNNLQRQPLLALAVLARHNGETVSMVQLAEEMFELGGLRRKPVAPDAGDIRYRILRPFKKHLIGKDNFTTEEIDGLVETISGVGLKLHVRIQATLVGSGSQAIE